MVCSVKVFVNLGTDLNRYSLPVYFYGYLHNFSVLSIVFWFERTERWRTTARVYERKNARLKFIKFQSGMGITILLYLSMTKNYWFTGGLLCCVPFSIWCGMSISATWKSSYEKEPITTSFILVGYRLCVCAAGSLITVIFICSILMIVSCLHFGQKRGKFFSTVSSRILSRVLLPHIGQFTHWIFSIVPPQFIINFLIEIITIGAYIQSRHSLCHKPSLDITVWANLSLSAITNNEKKTRENTKNKSDINPIVKSFERNDKRLIISGRNVNRKNPITEP